MSEQSQFLSRALTGAVVAEPDLITKLLQAVTLDDFDPPFFAIVSAVAAMHAENAPRTADGVFEPHQVHLRAAALNHGLHAGLLAELYMQGNPLSFEYHLHEFKVGLARRALASVGDAIDRASRQDDLRLGIQRVRELVDEAERMLVPQVIPLVDGDVLWDYEPPPDAVLLPGLLWRQGRVIITGSEGSGKALALDTPVPTPKGWSTMGDLGPGDEVFSPSGAPVKVVATTSPMLGRPCYRVTFSDGASVVADEQHLWVTETLLSREATARYARKEATVKSRGTDQRYKRKHFPAVVTTREIAETLTTRGGHAVNHSIATSAPLEYPRQEQPLHPYALGAWLGDGTSRTAHITSEDDQIPDLIRATGLEVSKVGEMRYLIQLPKEVYDGTKRRACARCGKVTRGWHCQNCRESGHATTVAGTLRALGLLQNKHIPRIYLEGDTSQRLALLQGLMDTDGTVSARGACEFSVTNHRLAQDVLELVLGLGIKATIREADAKLDGRVIGKRWRIGFVTNLPVFRLQRKAGRLVTRPTRRGSLRYITSCEPVESVPVRCIQVAAEDGMFLAGRQCIPTHNSIVLRQLVIAGALGLHPFNPIGRIDPIRTLYLDLENPPALAQERMRAMLDTLRNRGLAPPTNPTFEDRFKFLIRSQGIDIVGKGADRQFLTDAVETHRPDLLCIGPIYRMAHAGGDLDEATVGGIINYLNHLRVTYDLSVVTEAHPPHGASDSNDPNQRRVLRPSGSSAWMRFPEVGRGLRYQQKASEALRRPVFKLEDWRGDRHPKMRFPRYLARATNDQVWYDDVSDQVDTLAG